MKVVGCWCALLLAASVVAQNPGRSAAHDPQEPAEASELAPQDTEALCLALCEAQDRGAFTPLDAIAKLAGRSEAVARTAAAIVRHQWLALPQEFLIGLDANPKAAYRFLEELVRAPRPSVAQWVQQQTEERSNRPVDHRLLAMAARGVPLAAQDALLLLQALREQPVGDSVYFAAALLPERVADSLLGRLHQGLMQGDISIDAAMPLLDRLSLRGTKSLLGLAMTLPEATARRLLRHVYELRPQLVQERVAAALDGKVPLDALLLEFGQDLLDRPERIARVVALLDAKQADELQDRAFELLLSQGAIEAEVLAFANGSAARIRRVIAVASTHIPTRYVLAWLEHSPTIAEEMARALAMRPVLEPELQQRLLEILDGLGAADAHMPLHALTALVHAGDADALAQVWPLLMGSVAWRDLLYRLGRRTEPFVHAALVQGLQQAVAAPVDGNEVDGNEDADSVRQQKLDALRLLLVGRGDPRELDTLLARAPQRTASFVRKCRQYADTLSEAQAQSLLAAALSSPDPDVASELLEWVVLAQPKLAAERLWQLWNEWSDSDAPRSDELLALQEIALRLLVAGEHREDLLQQLRDAIAKGALPERLSSLPYEALNTMANPLQVTDVALCAELLLQLPLADPEAEQRRVARWPDGTVGFPLVAAVGQRLRTADALEAAQVFAAMVEQVRGDPRSTAISPQRLKVFWRSMSFRPDLQQWLGRITSRLWLVAPDQQAVLRDGLRCGGAIWLQACDAEWQGQFAEAEALYRQAGRELLRLPSMRGEVRWLLGDRDASNGKDPLAALSAAPYRMQWLAAKQAGDLDACAKASALVREFAGHDRETLATLSDNPVESGR